MISIVPLVVSSNFSSRSMLPSAVRENNGLLKGSRKDHLANQRIGGEFRIGPRLATESLSPATLTPKPHREDLLSSLSLALSRRSSYARPNHWSIEGS